MSGTYKPTEHGGLKEDGTPDKRVNTGEFAHGKVDPHEAGKEGGKKSGIGGGASGNDDGPVAVDNDDGDVGADDDYQPGDDAEPADTEGGGDYKPTEHGGLRKDGAKDGRVKQ